MLHEQMFPKVTSACLQAIATCIFFPKAVLPIACQNQGKGKSEMAYKHTLQHLIALPSSLQNSLKKRPILLTEGLVSESKVAVPRVLDWGVKSPPPGVGSSWGLPQLTLEIALGFSNSLPLPSFATGLRAVETIRRKTLNYTGMSMPTLASQWMRGQLGGRAFPQVLMNIFDGLGLVAVKYVAIVRVRTIILNSSAHGNEYTKPGQPAVKALEQQDLTSFPIGPFHLPKIIKSSSSWHL
ncbi:hypothetical protein EI94DRAFT_1706168 [Lactarius quietus]|nr:hypothetical protein EI94DRAFT_1706168 [Lactarius quietus]